MKITSIFAASSLFVAGAAVAQDTAPAAADNQAQSATSATEAPQAAEATPTTNSASVTDSEVDLFALAAMKVEKIAADETLDQTQKQASMSSAVQDTGLAPQRFNEIAIALQTDQALNERVQLAAAKHAQPVEAAEPAEASSE
ncbi:DUF4168 domain-containing protein [Parasphingorhabdus sp. JC815]|uniref:DUF4168 domain-containing protein n=1 Tax=Parasphingorhabdus sp. JC815 TaxID=3232140 RepID=UPI003458E3E3